MEEYGLTHKDLAKALGVSETTIKSYRRKFPGCITVASKGKPIRFAPEAETVCRRIQSLFALGMAVEDVRTRLAGEFGWIKEEPVPEAAPQEVILEKKAEHKKALLSEAARLKETLAQGLQQNTSEFVKVGNSALGENTQPSAQDSRQNITSQRVQDAPKKESVNQALVFPPELRSAISDMARSVVELSLQQKKLVKHVQSLEERLSALQNNQQGIPTENINSSSITEAESLSVEAEEIENEQKQSRVTPLLKIFGLERHATSGNNIKR